MVEPRNLETLDEVTGGHHLELSAAMQDYLKVLYTLEEDGEPLTNTGVASALEISGPSVSRMMRKLAEKGCVKYSPYRNIQLTVKGRRVALEMIRHHRLLELFLVKVLGMRWDEVHEEAERLEHVISEKLEERIAQLMDNPAFDPHGHPIPGARGNIRPALDRLDLLEEGIRAIVREVSDSDPEALQYLSSEGIALGTEIQVSKIHPFDGPVEVNVDGKSVILGYYLAQMVKVEPLA